MSASRSGLPLIPYVRVSRVGAREGEGFISIPEQMRTIEQLARERGFELLPELFEDLDASGGTTDRPRFQEALELVRRGRAAGIAVATLDRFSRDTGDALALIREVETVGGRLVCGDGDVSLGNGADAFTATVRLAAASFERARRAEYLDKSRRSAIERGVHLAIPFGYRRSDGRGSRLEPVPEQAAEVRRAYELRADGLSWQAIADALNAAGSVREPRGWNLNAVRKAILSDVYEGTAHSGDFRTEDAHPAIVPAALAAQARRTRGTKSRSAGAPSLLAGLVRCASCGYACKHETNAAGRSYYRCVDRAGVGCRGLSVPARPLEQLVEEELVAYLDETGDHAGAGNDAAADAARELVEAASERLRRIVRGLGAIDEANELERNIFEEELASARAALARAVEQERATRYVTAGVDLPTGLTAEEYPRLEVAERRHLLSALFSAIVVRRAVRVAEPVADRAEILLANEAPSGRALIPFLAGRNGAPARAGVAAL